MTDIPDDSSSLSGLFAEMKANYAGKGLRSVKERRDAIERLMQGYQKMKPDIEKALNKDLGYSQFMSNFLAHSVTLNEIKDLSNNVENWCKPTPVSTPISIGVANSSVEYEPLGLVLVISAWNYPIYTALPQVAAAISAGNSVILKPSELAPHTSRVLRKLFDEHMDSSTDFESLEFFRCVEGKINVSRALTKLPFDMICFTGSSVTGRLVAIEAAKNLAPCLLELGGKCPAIVDQSADIKSAAKRILFGKYVNCGQTCVGVDHVYVHESLRDKFKSELVATVKQFYPERNLSTAQSYTKIISHNHFERIEEFLNENHGGQIIYQSGSNKEERFMGPVIVDDPSNSSRLMNEEIFGPILPIKYYQDLQQLCKTINSRSKPLVIYLFSSKNENLQTVNKNTRSGSIVVNDSVVHLLNPHLPFGGVGNSGYGRYHGRAGFLAFSNPKSICKTKPINMYPLSNRFPPYTSSKQKHMNFLLKLGGITYEGLGHTFKYVLLGVSAIAIVSMQNFKSKL